MRIHQLFLPLVGEANEHILARALQTLSVIRDKVHEALNVDIVFKVDGQNVSQFRSSRRLLRLANWKRGFSKIKRIETLEPSPQYYRITSHYETLRMICGHTLGRICSQITCVRIASLPTRVVGAFSKRGVEVSPFSLQSLSDGRICSQSR